MNKPYYLWLNDTSPQRYYWNQFAQNWTTKFEDATLFSTQREASDEVVYASYTTKSEVMVGTARLEPGHGD